MPNRVLLVGLLGIILMSGSDQSEAEARREGGDDVLRKAQYMLRQLNQEKSELQQQVATLQARVDELEKEQNKAEDRLAKSHQNNQRLIERVESDAGKYNKLIELYRDNLNTLRRSSADNQYLVKAVEEREQWIGQCRENNQKLYEANIDLLGRYRKAATWFSEPVTGISTVTVENEAQNYRFKLEDLQVTPYKPDVDVSSHVRTPSSIN